MTKTAIVIRPNGSWRWQHRASIREYRPRLTRDGRPLWALWRVHGDVAAGNKRSGAPRGVEPSPHNKPLTPSEFRTWLHEQEQEQEQEQEVKA